MEGRGDQSVGTFVGVSESGVFSLLLLSTKGLTEQEKREGKNWFRVGLKKGVNSFCLFNWGYKDTLILGEDLVLN